MNALHAIARLGADPEIRQTRSGTSVLELRFAIDARVKEGDDWQTKTTWLRASLFGKRAEALSGRLSKGDRIGISGALYSREFERNDGSKGTSLELLNADVTLLGGRETGGGRREKPRDFGGGGDYADFGAADEFGDDQIPFAHASELGRGPHDPMRRVQR